VSHIFEGSEQADTEGYLEEDKAAEEDAEAVSHIIRF
jgi:hypothetical protein